MTPFDAPTPGRPGPPGSGMEPRVLSLPSLGGHPKIKDVIYEELRERIVFGGFAPGDRLVEADLASRFGVSKTPVREALLTLEAEGMVVLRPHRGAEVSPLTVEEWNDLIFLRDVLEIGALPDIFAAMTDEHFERADAALAEMTAACTESDYRRYRRAQRELHGIILGAPGRPSLPDAALRLNDRLDRYGRTLVTRDAERWAGDLDMNRRRLELIREGDAQAYAVMIRSRHSEAVTVIEQLAGQAAMNSADRSVRGGRRRANG